MPKFEVGDRMRLKHFEEWKGEPLTAGIVVNIDDAGLYIVNFDNGMLLDVSSTVYPEVTVTTLNVP